ncbi:MFS transporter [Marinomonas mediterranea]|jgi:Nitrate/nitrite transporter|uniref:Major facilitator superfamily MFS_1 n=1 Tax=Marinomonas mediterranea (strain ATCC 700492 / JCM 21426 / NBRC 103028 / MMB-1) TaxID=717774 RepID=F2JZE6_MARM1|nr:MFS transporter [Marinomonas mediterranea]ADZ89729.1 major facilitator superfamily MFS_1 [Marinomonas mediterranea MMB-1]WCN07822.1 MFS transporter [Marinomonas mediterranea]WCN11916.1 MFS transporter [Marinomonas mediterranea]WCN15954.1 MFS transporter [Marinomonas mediterranea MMB-1]
MSTSEFTQNWRVLLASFIGIAVGVSSIYFYSIGIFMKPLAAEFGWTRADSSLGALIGTLCAAAMVIPTGWLVDRFGSVKVCLVSLALLSGSFFALGAFTQDLSTYLILIGLMSMITAGSTPLPFTRLVVVAFRANRGKALGIILTGTGVGAMLLPDLLAPYIAEHGWRAGYYALGVVVAVCIPVIGVLLMGARDTEVNTDKSEPSSTSNSSPVASSFLSNGRFYHLCAIFLLTALAVLGTVAHFFSMLTDSGLTPPQAGAVASLIGISVIVGRLIVGFLLDRFSAAYITAGLFLVASVGFLTLGLGGPQYAKLGAVITGLAIGAEVDLIAFLIGRLFARQIYGIVYGVIYAVFLVGGAVGPYVAGRMFDASGSYSSWLIVASCLLLVSSALSLFLPVSKATEELNASVKEDKVTA